MSLSPTRDIQPSTQLFPKSRPSHTARQAASLTKEAERILKEHDAVGEQAYQAWMESKGAEYERERARQARRGCVDARRDAAVLYFSVQTQLSCERGDPLKIKVRRKLPCCHQYPLTLPKQHSRGQGLSLLLPSGHQKPATATEFRFMHTNVVRGK
eukprot:scaffold215196_cov17-Tisochrysis_lutea.AAC.1